MMQKFYTAYVKPYEDELAALTRESRSLTEAFTEKIRLRAVSGDVVRHPFVIVKRKPASWVYDDKAVLAAIELEIAATVAGEPAHDESMMALSKLIRVKKELEKRELNKALGAGELTWLPVEQAEQDYTVTLAPLTDILAAVEGE
jgi:hypothetical protein